MSKRIAIVTDSNSGITQEMEMCIRDSPCTRNADPCSPQSFCQLPKALIVKVNGWIISVSYTHLDVYKRQDLRYELYVKGLENRFFQRAAQRGLHLPW